MFNLLEQLKQHQPFDEAEANSVKTIIEFLENNTNCYCRSNLKGHVTAGALVVHTNGKILLNHHKLSGMWFQFGGHSDKNSNSYEVAKREVFEESGISDFVEASEKVFDADHHVIVDRPDKNEPSHYHYDINFLFVTDSDYFKLSNESSGAKWVTLEEAKQLISPDDISMKRMLAKYELYLKNKK